MGAPHDRKGSADKMCAKQDAHRHDNQIKTKDGMPFPFRVATRAFRVIRKMWNDYRNGRNMRKPITQEQSPRTGEDYPGEAEDESSKKRNRREIPVSAIEQSLPSKDYQKNPPTRRQQEVIERWVHQGGEWPWRIEQVVHQDPSDNMRGICVLEVKDLYAV
ncbi:hypothetical protein F4859DRAFT_521859 [Xylaria cf. heliscus]|nr:hypothetical protein F4859DRAFT_521859 [Xylaria cf. heliscus]